MVSFTISMKIGLDVFETKMAANNNGSFMVRAQAPTDIGQGAASTTRCAFTFHVMMDFNSCGEVLVF